MKLVIVGEAWGAREHLFSHAFVGSSGQELAKMLASAQIAPEIGINHPSEIEMIAHWKKLETHHGIALANVFNARPEDNNLDFFFTNAKEGESDLPPLRMGKYLKPELRHHLETLWQRLRELKPNLILALGNTACWAVLGENRISSLRGTIKASPILGFKVLPTYHPAAVLRQWNLRPIVLTDLEKAQRECEFSEIKRIERWLTIEPNFEEIAEWFNRPADFYAVDIETPMRKQLGMIGFARNPQDALVIPLMDERKPEASYWPTVEEEVRAWKWIDKFLKKPIPKVFQNGVFDLSHLLTFGFRPTMCLNDTMLLHHALYPEMLKGLGFLGSVYSDEIAWKTMRGKGHNLKRDE